MPKTRTLTLRDVPEKVVRSLRTQAQRNRRSMQKELLAIVEHAVIDRASWLAQIEEFRRLYVRKGLSVEQIHEAIEDGRP